MNTKTPETDPSKMPVSAITDGWLLTSNELYLLVKCEDGLVRATSVKRDPKK